MGLIASQLLAVMFLGLVRPHQDPNDFKLEFFNESMIFTLIYHVMLFTDFVPDKVYKVRPDGTSYMVQELIGDSMILFTLALAGTNLGILIVSSIKA
jgi:hypothetical protein